jgi:ketosteroid isomerase-like protein
MKSNTEIVQGIYAAFGAGNLPAILAVQSEDVVWAFPGAPDVPYAGEYHGKEGVAAFFQRLLSTAAFDAFSVEGMVADGDSVVVFGGETVRCLKSDKSAKNEWAMHWKLTHGIVNQMTSYEDTAALARVFAE